ncbi:MAG: metallopeptidase family protein [Armatimonadota bacterium]|nr:metallopeptidase family protein [Armatimonadota bacterium]MDR7439415.1 metallopeptidase family protein [Armatimonadota bacterium]MDR7563056.1 metallopeptidase family protein [Armatimonadota bacterium]MDR7568124.1 metallopeptidase family protein [Armatimonadota bacterium]MDR7602903.1 metallopeptidase family protein [Armatimonadota bacterium]
MTRKRFERLVEEILRTLPPEFRRALENVHVVVEDEPTPEQLASVGLGPGDLLFGLYEGTPLPGRGLEPPLLPDRITVFLRPLLKVCETEEELREEIRRTVLHELAHHFGLEEDRLEELGYG